MLVLGICGSLNLISQNKYRVPPFAEHDAAAVLLKNGKVIAAIEEERLTRLKHCPKFPINAIKSCLTTSGTNLQDVDKIAVYGHYDTWKSILESNYYNQFPYGINKEQFELDPKKLILQLLHSEFNYTPSNLDFVPHHLCHAASAYYLSGYESALVMVADGGGDKISGGIWDCNKDSMDEIATISLDNSLGLFYLKVTNFLGFKVFDEYKVMGLAPYGDITAYDKNFQELFNLLPNGKWEIYPDKIFPELTKITSPRISNSPIEQVHKDIASSLQHSLEKIMLHALKYYRQHTNLSSLCFAGGVAHNCTLNGKILYSNIFDSVFIQPAAHDAGCALGAALVLASKYCTIESMKHIYWGTPLSQTNEIYKTLNLWSDLIDFQIEKDVSLAAASKIAQGEVIAWVQGRSEFGPRALGNRSILADPRPLENKERINKLIKKREGFRPFAPAVLIEEAYKYFQIPKTLAELSYMTYALQATTLGKMLLKATTHVDGSARVQTVSNKNNPLFWSLINHLKDLIGVPIVLNTSFNNNYEPIVDNIQDAITCFLTTGLHSCFIDNYSIKIKYERIPMQVLGNFYPLVLPHWQICTTINSYRKSFEIKPNCSGKMEIDTPIYGLPEPISEYMISLIENMSGEKTIFEAIEAINGCINGSDYEKIYHDILRLWDRRIISLTPVPMNKLNT